MSRNHATGKEFLQQLMRADEQITRRLTLAAKPEYPLGRYRRWFMFLEFSGHGIPCLGLTFFLAWWVRDVTGMVFFVNLFFAQLFDLVLIALLKIWCKRERPSSNQDDMFFTHGPDKYSFPSGHASRAILLASVVTLATNLNGPMKLFVFLWSLSVCFSRVVLGRHNVGDVAAGMVIGLFEYYAVMLLLWLHPRNAVSAASYVYTIPDHFHHHCSMTDTCQLHGDL